MNYPDSPTTLAKINSQDYDSKLLGKNDLGSVYIHGPFGNSDSNIKIAYLIGMHPLESKSHRALFEELTSCENLNYCYYLYNIEVDNPESESEGRLEGQLLAQEFVKDEIINNKYDLFLDIHSNRGSRGPGEYKITNFVFAPGFDEKSTEYVRSSPSFITEPTAEAGIATIVYECYSYEPMDVSRKLAGELVNCVDNLIF